MAAEEDDSGHTITEYILVIAMVSLLLILVAGSQGEGSIYQGFRRLVERLAEKFGMLFG